MNIDIRMRFNVDPKTGRGMWATFPAVLDRCEDGSLMVTVHHPDTFDTLSKFVLTGEDLEATLAFVDPKGEYLIALEKGAGI